MRSAYVLHGCCDRNEFENTSIPSGSNFHWIPWLQKQLIVRGINCQTPEMPTPYKPSYRQWRELFDCYPLSENVDLVGHSCGGGFLLRYLAEKRVKINKLVLVAPWIDPMERLGSFLDFTIDPDLTKLVSEMHVLFSLDEPVEGVEESVRKIKQIYPDCIYHEFKHHGHFCLDDMKTDNFPELLDIIVEFLS